MNMEYTVRIESGTLDDLMVEWLVENCTDTYSITAQDVWNPGKEDNSAMFSHAALLVRFVNAHDAAAFKLAWT